MHFNPVAVSGRLSVLGVLATFFVRKMWGVLWFCYRGVTLARGWNDCAKTIQPTKWASYIMRRGNLHVKHEQKSSGVQYQNTWAFNTDAEKMRQNNLHPKAMDCFFHPCNLFALLGFYFHISPFQHICFLIFAIHISFSAKLSSQRICFSLELRFLFTAHIQKQSLEQMNKGRKKLLWF